MVRLVPLSPAGQVGGGPGRPGGPSRVGPEFFEPCRRRSWQPGTAASDRFSSLLSTSRRWRADSSRAWRLRVHHPARQPRPRAATPRLDEPGRTNASTASVKRSGTMTWHPRAALRAVRMNDRMKLTGPGCRRRTFGNRTNEFLARTNEPHARADRTKRTRHAPSCAKCTNESRFLFQINKLTDSGEDSRGFRSRMPAQGRGHDERRPHPRRLLRCRHDRPLHHPRARAATVRPRAARPTGRSPTGCGRRRWPIWSARSSCCGPRRRWRGCWSAGGWPR